MDIKLSRPALTFLQSVLAEYARQALVLRAAICRRELTSATLVRLDTAWLELRVKLELYASGSNPNDRAKIAILSGRVARRFVALADQLAEAQRHIS